MKKSKALLSIALYSLVVAGSAVGTNAATALKPHSGFDVISNSITVKDNTLNVYTYNMDNTATGGIKLAGNIDLSGSVDVNDVTALQQYLSELPLTICKNFMPTLTATAKLMLGMLRLYKMF